MFLKEVYKYNKILTLAIVLYILAYIVINYKQGLVCTPIYQYGMYSSKMYLKDTQIVYTIIANNKIIDNSKVGITNLDILQVYPNFYLNQKAINKNVFNCMNKYFSYFGLDNSVTENKFSNQINDSIFFHFFISKIEKIINEPISNLQILEQKYLWNGKEMSRVLLPSKMQYFVSN